MLLNDSVPGKCRALTDEITRHSPYMPTPKISIILPVRNGRTYIERCLDSLWGQTYPNKEIIVFDGGSTDGTVEFLQGQANKLDVFVSEPDRGNYEAMNKGVRNATGEWLYFIGADDYLCSPDALIRMVPHLARAWPGVSVVYGNVVVVNADEQPLHRSGVPWGEAKKRFLDYMTLPHQGVFHHRTLFERHGLFNESFRMTGDYEFLLRELKSGAALYANETVACYRIGGGSSLPGSALAVLGEMKRAQSLNGMRIPRFHWMLKWARAALRALIWRVIGERRGRGVIDWLRRTLLREPTFWTKT
ncbi:MAG: glycosyltransferase family 2 protein [Burkholderiales bacterium]